MIGDEQYQPRSARACAVMMGDVFASPLPLGAIGSRAAFCSSDTYRMKGRTFSISVLWGQVANRSRLASRSVGRLGSRIQIRQKALCHPLKAEGDAAT
jgi:hypothetical protein